MHVRVRSRYLPQRSDPASKEWFFIYTVRITNTGEETVQLVSRHWIITDGAGRTQHVRGPGVVGAQPVLEQGQAFEYTSFCPLPTPSGQMSGSFQMVTKDGAPFDAEVAAFALSEEMEFS
ncbi:MAG: Co2+/Mg2+ efflux protein ApaG [Deltaproteobacteria bacterium]|nr:Co2+/Mg2+ efflux protein ApaG [Deltaproteobacteria bacterium]